MRRRVVKQCDSLDLFGAPNIVSLYLDRAEIGRGLFFFGGRGLETLDENAQEWFIFSTPHRITRLFPLGISCDRFRVIFSSTFGRFRFPRM